MPNQSNLKSFIESHFVVLLIVGIASIVGAVIGTQAYLDDHYVSNQVYNERYANTSRKLDDNKNEISKRANKLSKDIKDSTVYLLRFRKKFILAIPEGSRTERENTELGLIVDELHTLNAQ